MVEQHEGKLGCNHHKTVIQPYSLFVNSSMWDRNNLLCWLTRYYFGFAVTAISLKLVWWHRGSLSQEMKDQIWAVSSYLLDVWLIHHLATHCWAPFLPGCDIWPDGANQSPPFLIQFQLFLESLTALCVHPSLLIQIKKNKYTLRRDKILTIFTLFYLSELAKYIWLYLFFFIW